MTQPPEQDSADWRDAAEQWGHDQLRRLNRRATGPMVADSIQPWSAVWRMPTDMGDVLIKQTTPVRAYEGTVTQFCATVAPGQVTRPLAVDDDSARLLLTDGGTTLYGSDPVQRGLELDRVTAIIGDYGCLQQATSSAQHRPDSLPCWDPATAGDEALLQAKLLHDLPEDDPRHIDDERFALIAGLRSELNGVGSALAASPIPNAVDQGDLWPGNILPPRHGGHYRFIDFGDAAWTHPFLSIRMLIVECQYRWAVPEVPGAFNVDHPILKGIIDQYLRAWAEFADLPRLRMIMNDALRLAPLRRSQAWIANLEDADDEAIAELGHLPWSWLADVTQRIRTRQR